MVLLTCNNITKTRINETYPTYVFSLFSIALCLITILVNAIPISRVPPTKNNE